MILVDKGHVSQKHTLAETKANLLLGCTGEKKKKSQQAEGRKDYSLLGIYKTAPDMLCPVLGLPVQKTD